MRIPLPKLREFKEAVIALIRGPYTSPFPAQEPAIPAAFRGFPNYDDAKCVGCGACANVCPARAIELVDDLAAAQRMLTLCLDRCITCGTCQANCITKEGVRLGHEYDLTTYDRAELRQRRVQKELVICEVCNEAVGVKEHILWVARRLGPLAFSNPSLMLTMLQGGAAARRPGPPFEQGLKRGDKVRILCPRCRQEISFIA